MNRSPKEEFMAADYEALVVELKDRRKRIMQRPQPDAPIYPVPAISRAWFLAISHDRCQLIALACLGSPPGRYQNRHLKSEISAITNEHGPQRAALEAVLSAMKLHAHEQSAARALCQKGRRVRNGAICRAAPYRGRATASSMRGASAAFLHRGHLQTVVGTTHRAAPSALIEMTAQRGAGESQNLLNVRTLIDRAPEGHDGLEPA